MSEAVAYTPTPSFTEAAAYLSHGTGSQKVSNETKLEVITFLTRLNSTGLELICLYSCTESTSS